MADKLDDAMRDPGEVFSRPSDVLGSDFSTAEKRQILQSWEDQLQKRQIATAEGMAVGGDKATEDLLAALADARRKLED